MDRLRCALCLLSRDGGARQAARRFCGLTGAAMSNHTITFESNRTGVAPESWTATLTGTGNPQWTVERDDTAPSGAKIVRQSGRATFPLLLKDGISIKA